MAHYMHGTKDFAKSSRRAHVAKNDGNLDTHPELAQFCISCTRDHCGGTCAEYERKRREISRAEGRDKKTTCAGWNAGAYEYKGRVRSAAALVREENLIYARFRDAIRAGKTVEEAVEASRRPPSKTEQAAAAGLTAAGVRWRISQGMTREEALAKPPGKGDRYMWNGVSYTLPRLAKATGIYEATLRYRLKQGMTVEEAVNTPLRSKGPSHSKMYMYRGEEYTLHKLAELSSMLEQTLYWRISHGMTVEEAVDTPPANTNKKKHAR